MMPQVGAADGRDRFSALMLTDPTSYQLLSYHLCLETGYLFQCIASCSCFWFHVSRIGKAVPTVTTLWPNSTAP